MKRLVLLCRRGRFALRSRRSRHAHPLGNFTVNRFSRDRGLGHRALRPLRPGPGRDPNVPGRSHRRARLRAAHRARTRISTVDGRTARLVPFGSALAHPVGAGGLRTTRLEVVLAGPRLNGSAAVRLPRHELQPTGSAGRRSWSARARASTQRRAPRLPEGPPREPARRRASSRRGVAPGDGPDVAPSLSRGQEPRRPPTGSRTAASPRSSAART